MKDNHQETDLDSVSPDRYAHLQAPGPARPLLDIAIPVIEDLGYELLRVRMTGDNANTVLQVMAVEENGTMTVEGCEKISRSLSAVLDVEDPITVAYTLEVSSPGIERPLMKLEHYQLYIGKEVKIRLTWSVNDRKNFLGTLVRVEGDEIVIAVDGEEFSFPVNAVKRANLVYDGKM